MNRLLPVVRIQLINWRLALGLPVGVLVLTLAINLALFASIGDAVPPDGRTTGALLSIYAVVGTSFLQTMTQTFPFALGLSVTRRTFYASVALLATVEALAFLGVVFQRWGQLGVWAVSVATAVVLAGVAVLLTWQGGWPAFGRWFAAQPVPALFAGYPLVLALLLGAAGWLAIRRATP